MGYTVYFTHNRDFTMQEWGDIRAAVIPMLHRLKQIKGGDGTGRPVIDNSDIIFNGDASKDEDHETFQLSKCNSGFQFCKTARKPYDRYVKAVLVVANMIAPGALDISCDGDDEDGCWDEGVRIADIYLKIPGRSACSPLEAKRFAEMKEAAKAPSSPYEGAFTEIDEAIEVYEKMSKGNKVHSFLANYLKANIDDLKDAWTP